MKICNAEHRYSYQGQKVSLMHKVEAGCKAAKYPEEMSGVTPSVKFSVNKNKLRFCGGQKLISNVTSRNLRVLRLTSWNLIQPSADYWAICID